MLIRHATAAVTVAVLAGLLAGCSSSSTPAAAGNAAPPTSPSASTPPAASASPTAASPAASCDLTKEPDVILWERAPGLPDSAQELGGWNPSTCTSSIDSIMSTVPTGDGYCSRIAYASDNPGYNADATPAAPLKKVIESIGPAC